MIKELTMVKVLQQVCALHRNRATPSNYCNSTSGSVGMTDQVVGTSLLESTYKKGRFKRKKRKRLSDGVGGSNFNKD